MVSTLEKEPEWVLIAVGITVKSCKLIAKEFVELEDVLVSFVKVYALESYLTDRYKEMR